MANVVARVFMVLLFAVLGLVALLPAESKADPITVDEEIFQFGNGLDTSQLEGTIDMEFNAGTNTLTVVLTNISGDAGGLLAQNLLTGIGFNLPTGVTIDTTASNTVISLTGGSSVSPSGSISDTLWGYSTGGVNGPFQELVSGGSINVDFGTVQSMIDRDFNNTTAPPANVQGPNFGILSSGSGYAGCNGGLPCVVNSLTFNIVLSGTYGGDLLDFIEEHHVVLAFGSPTAPVPEPASLLLLGSGLVGLWIWSNRQKALSSVSGMLGRR